MGYCSAVWCSAADTHLKLLDRAVSGAQFLTGGVIECDISHRRSVAVRCILYKIRCNPMHPLNGALPGPYVPARVTRGALVAHQYTYAPPRCRTLKYSRTFIPFSVSLWNNHANPVFDGVGLAGFKSKANASLLALLYPYSSLLSFSRSLLSVYRLVLWGWGLRTDKKVKSSMAKSLPLENLLPQNVGSIINYLKYLLKLADGELLVAVNRIQLRTMSSETVDPIDCLHPPPYTEQYAMH